MFVAFSLLHVVLVSCAYPIYMFDPTATGPAPGVICTTWMWVFAFPYMAAWHVGLESIAPPLMFLNPLIYGLIWTFAWQMYRLHRHPPAEG